MSRQAEAPEKQFFVRFVGAINLERIVALLDAVRAAVGRGCNEIHLGIKSPGGCGMSAAFALRLLEELRVPVTTYARKIVYSAGVPLYMRGDVRIAEPDAEFMLHPPVVEGAAPKDADLMRAKFSEDIAAILAKRTRLTLQQAKEFGAKETFLSAQQALEVGIVHRLGAIQIPPEAESLDLFYPMEV